MSVIKFMRALLSGLIIVIFCSEIAGAQQINSLQSSSNDEQIILPVTVLTETGNIVTALPQSKFSVLLDKNAQTLALVMKINPPVL
jgi:hypothetical protein